MSDDQRFYDLNLLLIDDEEVIHRSVGTFLEKMGCKVTHAFNGKEGLELFFSSGADIIISDISMPGLDGIELLDRLQSSGADVEVILITGNGDTEAAIAALRHGAFDFFNKPVKLPELIASLERTRRYQAMRREKGRIQEQLEVLMRSGETVQNSGIIGESLVIKKALNLVDKVAEAERTTVLIRGESGTGKELFARALHERSPRADKPFVTLNCTAVPETLFESELFGHEKGAFTDAKSARKGMFELSAGGTLFLDEIGDMSVAAQAKILRALEERRVRRVGGEREIPIDVRLVTATHQDLQQMQEEGTFRQDLFFRLNVFTIDLPPLRSRGDDILLLSYHFLKQFATELGKDIVHIDSGAQKLLKSYPFPGNIRELRNLMERAVILCEGDQLSSRDFAELATASPGEITGGDDETSFDLAELEERAIRRALAKADSNQTEAARYLGIGHDALRYRLKKYNINCD
jgi:two-component system, NtrC family, response regulator AtoC